MHLEGTLISGLADRTIEAFPVIAVAYFAMRADPGSSRSEPGSSNLAGTPSAGPDQDLVPIQKLFDNKLLWWLLRRFHNRWERRPVDDGTTCTWLVFDDWSYRNFDSGTLLGICFGTLLSVFAAISAARTQRVLVAIAVLIFVWLLGGLMLFATQQVAVRANRYAEGLRVSEAAASERSSADAPLGASTRETGIRFGRLLGRPKTVTYQGQRLRPARILVTVTVLILITDLGAVAAAVLIATSSR